MKSDKTRNIEQYENLYKEETKFGTSSYKKLDEICFILKSLSLGSSDRVVNVVDFGCGKSELSSLLQYSCANFPRDYTFYRYDPAIPEICVLPIKSADFLINTDVLEHIHENEIDIILSDIFSISNKCYFNISTRLAKRILPNGENAHVTVRPAEWWLLRLKKYHPSSYLLRSKNDEATIVTFDPGLRVKWYYKTFSIRRNFKRIWKKIKDWSNKK